MRRRSLKVAHYLAGNADRGTGRASTADGAKTHPNWNCRKSPYLADLRAFPARRQRSARPGGPVPSTLDMNKGDPAPARAHVRPSSSQQSARRDAMPNDFTCDVLIVEDERIQCEEMAAFLARAGLSVATAHDGATGLAQARRFPPRVALLDYNLPDMTGVQLAEKLR